MDAGTLTSVFANKFSEDTMKIISGIKDAVIRLAGKPFRYTRRTRIVMFHEGRSGSSVLALMLHDHPKVFWAGEILKSRKVFRYQKVREAFDYRDIIQETEERTFRKCFGFEMKYEHMRQLGITKADFLKSLDKLKYTHFIILTRRNSLRRITSLLIAKKAGYYRLPTDKKPEHIQVELDAADLIPQFKQYTEDIAEIEKLLEGRPVLHLTYEDDIEQDPGIGYGKVIHFLNLPMQSIAPRIQRINARPPRDLILNFDEVVKSLAHTEYAWMLEQ